MLWCELVSGFEQVVGELDDWSVAIGDGVEFMAHGVRVSIWFVLVSTGDMCGK